MTTTTILSQIEKRSSYYASGIYHCHRLISAFASEQHHRNDRHKCCTAALPSWQSKRFRPYRLLRANNTNQKCVQGTSKVLRDISFTMLIDLSNLTEYNVFQVVSVSNRFQHSEPSQIYDLKKPDKVTPSALKFDNVQASESRRTSNDIHT